MKKVYLRKAPRTTNKKWEVTLPSGKVVRFGALGYEDFTIHGNAKRMVRYIVRHGGVGTSSESKDDIIRIMSKRRKSSKENWSVRGINTPGFWSRWLLWSYPTINSAARYIEKHVLPKGEYQIIKRR